MKITKDFKNKLNKNDYLKYLLGRNMILVISPIVIVAFIVAITMTCINYGFTWQIFIYMLPIILFIISYFQVYRLIKYTLKSQKELYQLEITLTDNEYKDLTNGEENSFPYEKAYCYKETKNYFYLHVDKSNALIIPKREFNEQEIDQIRKTFSSKMAKRPLLSIGSILTTLLFIALVVIIIISLTLPAKV